MNAKRKKPNGNKKSVTLRKKYEDLKKIHFLSDLPRKEKESICLYRYMPLKYLRTLLSKDRPQIVFMSPQKWEDPYEKRFLYGKYGIENFQDKIACICFTTNASENEAAAWCMYDRERKNDIVQVSFDFDNLLIVLNGYGDRNGVDFYIGMVDYNIEVDELKGKKDSKVKKIVKECSAERAALKLMLLKRKAFKFEGEVRIIAMASKPLSDEKMIIPLEKGHSLIKQIKAQPFLPNTIVTKELLKKEFSSVKIVRSQLYDSVPKFNYKQVKNSSIRRR